MSFDSSKFGLGIVCKRGHEYLDTGMSLRRLRKRRGKVLLDHCVECEKEQARINYMKNREQRLESSRRNAAANPEKQKEHKRRHYEQNFSKIKLQKQEYRKIEKNRLRHNELNKKYRQQNPEKIKEQYRNYRQTPKAKLLRIKNDALRRSRRRAATDEEISVADMEFLCNLYNDACAYCGCKDNLTIDHLVPISKNGKHKLTNLVPACKRCNSSKSNREIYQWYWSQQFFNEDRLLQLISNMLTIHKYRSSI